MRLAVALAVLLPGLAAAQEIRERPLPRDVLPGIGAQDPRRPVDPAAPPWRALGRVQTELGGRCTGVMLGPRTVLTAAHCLVAPRTGRVVQPGSVHFLLGYHLGRWAAMSRVASYVTGPGWEAGRGAPGADWAVLTLDAPVGTPDRILPLVREAPAPRTPLMLGGYQQDRPEVILADTACRAIGLHAGTGGLRTFVHDCAGTRGASGAPVLVQQGDGWAVAGIVSVAATEMALGHAVPAAAVRLP